MRVCLPLHEGAAVRHEVDPSYGPHWSYRDHRYGVIIFGTEGAALTSSGPATELR